MDLNSTNPFLNDIGAISDMNLLLDENHPDIRPFVSLQTSTPAPARTIQVTPPMSSGVNPIMVPPAGGLSTTGANVAPNVIYVQPAPTMGRQIQDFSGFAQEDAAKFLAEFDSYLTLSGIQADSPRALAAFHLNLKGPARVWLTNLDSKDTWTQVRDAFVNEYCTVTHPSMIAESVQFDNLSLKPGQPIEDFHSIVLDKGRKLKKADTDMMHKFISGLPSQLAFFVRAGRVSNFRDALQSAKIGEAHGYREQPISHIQRQPDPKPQSVGSVQGPSLQKQLDDLSKKLDNLTTNQQRSKPPGVRGTSGPGRVCYKCHGQNHIQSKCNWNGQGKNTPEAKCQLCSQLGHIAPACATLVPSKPTEACQLCRGSDHSAKNCPALNSQGLGPARVSQT